MLRAKVQKMTMNEQSNSEFQLGVNQRTRIVMLFSPVGMAFLIVYAYVSFLDPDTRWYGYVLSVIFGIVTANLFLLRNPKRVQLAANTLAALGIPVLIPWLFNGGPLGHGFFWSLVWIAWCFLLSGRRWASYLLGLFFSFVGVCAILHQQGVIAIAYSGYEIIQLFFMYAFTVALFYVYDTQATAFENLAYRAVDKLVEQEAKAKKRT